MMKRSGVLLAVLSCVACVDGEKSPAETGVVTDTDTVRDDDGDGITSEVDCDDSDPEVHPYADEVCDGKDNNCDGSIDEGLDESFWRDSDSDGYGDPGDEAQACAAPDGYVDNDADCDDTDATVTTTCRADLGGDWPTTGQNIYRNGYFPGTVGEALLEPSWSVDLGYTLQGVTVADSNVYVPWQVYPGGEGHMTALDAVSGEEVWDYTIDDIRDGMMPGTLYDGSLYFAEMSHSDSRLWALDAGDGSALWSSPLSAQWYEYPAPLVYDDGIWVACGYYGGMVGFDRDDGTQRFSLGMAQYDEWTPSWYDEGWVISFVEGELSAHDPETGAASWTLDLGWDWGGWSMARQVAITGDTAVLCNNPGLYAVDLVTQTELWSVEESCTGTPATDGEEVFAIVSGQVRSYDLETGAFEQLFPGDGALSGQPIVTDDAVIVASSNNTYVYARSDASELDALSEGGAPVLSEGILYLTSGTTLSAWDFVEAE